MITLHEQFKLERPALEVFAYACEFANCPQWDSTALTAEKSQPDAFRVALINVVGPG